MLDSLAHARHAAQLLDGLALLEHRLESLTDDERLEMTVTGGYKRVNADQRWTAELAIAHALTAIALHLNGADGDDELRA